MHGGLRATLIVPSTTTKLTLGISRTPSNVLVGGWEGVFWLWIALFTRVAAEKSFLGFVHRARTLYPHPADREVASSPLRVTPPQGQGQRAAPPASTRGGIPFYIPRNASGLRTTPRLALPPNLHLGKAGLCKSPRLHRCWACYSISSWDRWCLNAPDL